MYDVIIVGAGPAGTTAALYAHKIGLKSLLIDKSFFPRDKVCGDALSGKSVRILRELNLLDDINDLNGSEINRITFGSPSNKQFDLLLNNRKNNQIQKGFVIKRAIFDSFLFNKADEVTETIQGFTVTDLIYDNQQIAGIKGKRKDGMIEEYHSHIVMGCDGYNSIIARKVGLYEMDTEHTAVGLRCYYKGVKGLTDQIELHYVKEVIPGYFWLFPAGDGIANIGLGIGKKHLKNKNLNLIQTLGQITKSDYFKDRFSKAEQLEKPVGWNLPFGSIHRKNHGDKFMLLGDAAGLIDPFTGEGIGNAMVSGKYAIEVAANSLNVGNLSEKSFSEYDNLLWDEIGKELRASTKLHKLAKSKFLLNFVMNRAARNDEVQEIISGMLSNEIPKDELSNPSFYFKILFS